MHVKKMKVLTGTMLSLLVSTVSVYPAIARPVGTESDQLLSQIYTSDIAKGTITKINGEMVTLELPSGGRQQITIDRDIIRRMNLQPGMEVVVNLNRGNIARGVRVLETNYVATTQPIKGTIRSIDDNVVMLDMPDGKMKRITLREGDIARLNLQPGTQISVMLDDQRMASDVSVIEVNTAATDSTDINTVRREETIIQRRTVEAIPAPPMVQNTPMTQTTEFEQQSTETLPVRALW